MQITFEDIDSLLEAFESAWNSVEPPDFFAFVRYCSPTDLPQIASELIQIDLERRWRSGNPELHRTLPFYLQGLAHVFSPDELALMVASEYRIRNQWGDCVTREQMLLAYPDGGQKLADCLEDVSQSIEWPVVSIILDGQTVMETRLDRSLEAGRQRQTDQTPWSVYTTPGLHQLTLSEMRDPTLSRNQLKLSLDSPDSVLICNTSSNRAIAVRGRGAIDSGQTLICPLPVFIHLGASRYLRVSRPSADTFHRASQRGR